MRAYNFRGIGRNLTKLYQGMSFVAEVITWTGMGAKTIQN